MPDATKEIKAEAALSGGSFSVYRAGALKPFMTLSGATVSCEISAGCLLLKNGGDVQFVFSPGQWATVNSVPG